jgi:hypothetical protein
MNNNINKKNSKENLKEIVKNNIEKKNKNNNDVDDEKINENILEEELENSSSSEDENEKVSEEELYIEANLNKNIERIQKKIDKFDKEVKEKIKWAQRLPNKKDYYKHEAAVSLKKKKFYEKIMNQLQERKFKYEIKEIDRNLKKEKKELKKITRDFQKKILLLTNPDLAEKIEENDEAIDDEGNLNIDMDVEEVEKKYKEIINRPDVIEASEKLNLFKFIFQDD